MKKERILTCIVCPRGCEIKVIIDGDGKIEGISGNACKRGAVYAEDECTHPKRTITSTVRCEDGSVMPVKTSYSVPKELVMEIMNEISKARVCNDAKIGDVLIENLKGLGVNLVVTGNKSK